MNNDLTTLSNQLKQLIQNQPSLNHLQGVSSTLDQLSSQSAQGDISQKRGIIAQIEASIQNTIDSIEGQQGMEALVDELNQLQVSFMNASQSMEHQVLNQTNTETIAGSPLHIDDDPQPGPPLS